MLPYYNQGENNANCKIFWENVIVFMSCFCIRSQYQLLEQLTLELTTLSNYCTQTKYRMLKR